MKSTARIALLWKLVAEEDEDGPVCYEYIAESGRNFERYDLDDGTYFVTECRPGTRCIELDDQGAVAKAWDDDRLKAWKQDPNTFFVKAEEAGIKEKIVLMGAGFGRGSITYPTLAEAEASVLAALDNNQWLEHHSLQLAQEESEARREQDLRSSLEYLDEQIAALEASMQAPQLLRGVSSHFPDNMEAIKQRLLAFRNAPSLETWERVARCTLLPNGTTGWQLWAHFDSTVPLSFEPDRGFETFPAPEQLFSWISQRAEQLLRDYRERREAKAQDLMALKKAQHD